MINSPEYNNALNSLKKLLNEEVENDEEFEHISSDRDKVLDRFQPIFSLEHVPDLTIEEFYSFLDYKNNCHWEGLHRTKAKICDHMDVLKDSLKLLLNDSIPIENRFYDAVNMVKGMGVAIATAILLVAFPDKYGVWNGKSEKGMKKVSIWPEFSNKTLGNRYFEINKILNSLAKDLDTDLWTLDILWHILLQEKQDINNSITTKTTYDIKTKEVQRFKDDPEPYLTKKGIIMDKNEPRNIIFFGPPGTGKSYIVNKRVNEMTKNKDNIIRTTFHPEYSYYDFVGQYKPVVGYENVACKIFNYLGKEIKMQSSNCKPFIYYDFVPGPFIKAIIQALTDTNEKIFLIIEEINRGNCAAIFGDIFQLLDRDMTKGSIYNGASQYHIEISDEVKAHIIKTLGTGEDDWNRYFKEGFKLPSNLYIYATMNTSDQSLFPMDSAFKRRWSMEYLKINYEEKDRKEVMLPEPYQEIEWLNFIRVINQEIVTFTQTDDKQLGQWFISGEMTKEKFICKLLSYLWFDVFRQEPEVLFKQDIKTYDDLIMRYKEGVLKEEVIQNLRETQGLL